MLVSDLRVVGQVGTTIGLGLLFDTLIVRSFMMPSVAALLGRWFWWPLNVREHPARARRQAVPVAATVQADAEDRTFEDMVASAFPELSGRPGQPADEQPAETLSVTQPPEEETER